MRYVDILFWMQFFHKKKCHLLKVNFSLYPKWDYLGYKEKWGSLKLSPRRSRKWMGWKIRHDCWADLRANFRSWFLKRWCGLCQFSIVICHHLLPTQNNFTLEFYGVPATHYTLLGSFADAHIDPLPEHLALLSPPKQFQITFKTKFSPSFAQKVPFSLPPISPVHTSVLALESPLWSPFHSHFFLSYYSSGVISLNKHQNHLQTTLQRSFWLSASVVEPKNLHF